jgi:fermentation-respiration switch protein FrsA (DUF1100 family)
MKDMGTIPPPPTRLRKPPLSVLWALSPLPVPLAPFWRRSRKHRAARVALMGGYAYMFVLLFLLSVEDRLLFPALLASQGWSDPPEGVRVEDVNLTAADGTPVHAWWSAPAGWKPEQGALLFCHGNGGNLSGRGWALPKFHKELGQAVLVFDYPGYGKSGGRPSEAGCYAAGDAAYAWLTDKQKVPGERIVHYGGSLGGGVATDLAVRQPHRALVLVSTFTSVPDVAQAVYRIFPTRWLVRNDFNSRAKIRKVSGPVFVAHAPADGLIPYDEGRQLYEAAPGPKEFFTMNDWGHNDVPSPACYAALRRFLDANAPLAAAK